MMRTEKVTETMAFDPAITQLTARERVIKLTGYCVLFIKRVSVEVVCVHASADVWLSRTTVLLSI
jgi:hypothetical protein